MPSTEYDREFLTGDGDHPPHSWQPRSALPKCELTIDGRIVPLVAPGAAHPLAGWRMTRKGSTLVLEKET